MNSGTELDTTEFFGSVDYSIVNLFERASAFLRYELIREVKELLSVNLL